VDYSKARRCTSVTLSLTHVKRYKYFCCLWIFSFLSNLSSGNKRKVVNPPLRPINIIIRKRDVKDVYAWRLRARPVLSGMFGKSWHRILNSWFRASWFNVNKKVQLDATVCRHLFTAETVYMFRASQHPSSGVLKTVSATSGISHAVKYRIKLTRVN